MFANLFKSQSIALTCVTFLVSKELDTNHLALVAEIVYQSRKRHLNKLLIVLLAHVGFLFPSGIIAYNQRSYMFPHKRVDNLTANLMESILEIAVSLAVHTSDSSCRSLYALQILNRLQVRERFVKVVIVRFEIFAAIDCAAFRSNHRSEIIKSKVDRSVFCLINISLLYFLFIDNFDLYVTAVGY